MKLQLIAASVAAALCLAPSPAPAQTKIRLINQDAPGVGLNDPRPQLPLGGNPGRTLGQQRQITFQYAADLWAALLGNVPEIRVSASFSPLACSKGYVVLGAASAASVVAEDRVASGGAVDSYYAVALANAVAGRDFDVAGNHIDSEFNARVDDVDCQEFGANGWFYGLHGNSPDNPEFRSNFLNVVMHEIGHGLGFYSLGVGTNLFDSPYGAMAWSNDSSKSYNDFERGEKALAVAIANPGRSVWKGEKATATAALLAENKTLLKITSPQSALHEFRGASFGAQDRSAMRGEIVLVDDEVLPGDQALHTGCDGAEGQPKIRNRDDLVGKVALVERGGCETGQKVLNVQNLGAVGVIVANDIPLDALPAGAGGSFRPQIKVPVITVTQEVGAALRSTVPVVAAGFVVDKTQFNGLDAAGRVKLYTPRLFAAGSTLSHIDPEMSPDAIMEAIEARGMRADVSIGMVLDMMEEMGWPTNRNGTAKLGNCDTGIPVYKDGFIPGANLIAHNNMCKTAFVGSRAQQLRCMNDQINWLHDQTLLSNAEVVKARQCVAKL